MNIVTADCNSISVPDIGKGDQEFEAYLKNIIDIGFIKNKLKINFCISEKVINKLIETDSYPFHPHLKTALTTFGLTEYALFDLLRITNKLLDTTVLEEYLCCNECLYSDLDLEPNIYQGNGDDQFTNINKDLIVLLLLSIKLDSNNKYILFINDYTGGNSSMQLRCNLEDVDCKLPIENDLLDNEINGELDFGSTAQMVIMKIDNLLLWKNACNMMDFQNSIKIGCYKDIINNSGPIEWERLPKFELREEFVKSVISNNFISDVSKCKRMIRTINDILLSRNKGKGHALRTGSSGNDPIRTRKKDNARAWRFDIDYEYHIHYWITEHGPEFAKLVVHNDTDIPE